MYTHTPVKESNYMKAESKLERRMTSSNNRKRTYGLLFLLALGAAMISVLLLHKLRERRVFDLLLQDRDRQLLALQLLVETQQEESKETKKKLEDMKAKVRALKSKRMELASKLSELQVESSYLEKMQSEMEISLAEKQKQISEKEEESIKANLQVATLTGVLKEKEAEVYELKQRITRSSPGNTDEGQEGWTAQNESQKQASDTEHGRVSDSNGTASKQEEEDKPREGQLVKFVTNIGDEGLADGNGTKSDTNINFLKKQKIQKVEGTRGTSASETREGESHEKLREDNAMEGKKEIVLEDEEQQVAASEERKVDSEGQEPKTRHRRAKRMKSKRNEQEKLNGGNAEDSEENENASEGDKSGGNSVMTSKSSDDGDVSRSLEKGKSSSSDESNESSDVSMDNIELNNKEQEAASESTNQENSVKEHAVGDPDETAKEEGKHGTPNDGLSDENGRSSLVDEANSRGDGNEISITVDHNEESSNYANKTVDSAPNQSDEPKDSDSSGDNISKIQEGNEATNESSDDPSHDKDIQT